MLIVVISIAIIFLLLFTSILIIWKFFPKLKEKIQVYKIKKYKRKKIKESKYKHETDYNIKFKIVLTDSDGNYIFNDTEFDITVPAHAAYFAKLKLVNHIKENINIQVVDIIDINN